MPQYEGADHHETYETGKTRLDGLALSRSVSESDLHAKRQPSALSRRHKIQEYKSERYVFCLMAAADGRGAIVQPAAARLFQVAQQLVRRAARPKQLPKHSAYGACALARAGALALCPSK